MWIVAFNHCQVMSLHTVAQLHLCPLLPSLLPVFLTWPSSFFLPLLPNPFSQTQGESERPRNTCPVWMTSSISTRLTSSRCSVLLKQAWRPCATTTHAPSAWRPTRPSIACDATCSCTSLSIGASSVMCAGNCSTGRATSRPTCRPFTTWGRRTSSIASTVFPCPRSSRMGREWCPGHWV